MTDRKYKLLSATFSWITWAKYQTNKASSFASFIFIYFFGSNYDSLCSTY